MDFLEAEKRRLAVFGGLLLWAGACDGGSGQREAERAPDAASAPGGREGGASGPGREPGDAGGVKGDARAPVLDAASPNPAEPSKPECYGDADCATPNECSFASCKAGRCVLEPLQRGSACSEGFCNGRDWCLPCIDDASGARQDKGCSEALPVCQETAAAPGCVECRQDADCNDGVPCTTDRCVDARCENVPLPIGAPCSFGFCTGEGDANSCAPCVDAVTTGVDPGCSEERPACDPTSTPASCQGCEQAAECDDGNDCTEERCHAGLCERATVLAGTPCAEGYCNGIAGQERCVTRRCLIDADCDDEAECTGDRCIDGLCAHEADHARCEDSGDACRPNLCTVGAGCLSVDVTRSVELLANGNLEAGNVAWTEMSANYGQVIFVYGYIPTLQPHSSPYVAWLGGGQAMDEVNSLSQEVSVPNGARALELTFFYQVWADELPDFHNDLVVRLVTDAGADEVPLVVLYNQDYTRVWTRFSTVVDASALAGTNVVLEFSGRGVDGYTHFFVDSVSLRATVCEAESG